MNNLDPESSASETTTNFTVSSPELSSDQEKPLLQLGEVTAENSKVLQFPISASVGGIADVASSDTTSLIGDISPRQAASTITESLQIMRQQNLSSSAKILDQFTLFPKLPIELRIKIWKMACLVPRVIDLRWCDVDEYSGRIFSSSETHYPGEIRSHCSPPSLLYVSSEARCSALQHYTIGFGTSNKCKFGTSTIEDAIPTHVWVNRGCDDICVLKHFDENGCLGSSHIRSLAEKVSYWKQAGSSALIFRAAAEVCITMLIQSNRNLPPSSSPLRNQVMIYWVAPSEAEFSLHAAPLWLQLSKFEFRHLSYEIDDAKVKAPGDFEASVKASDTFAHGINLRVWDNLKRFMGVWRDSFKTPSVEVIVFCSGELEGKAISRLGK
jgi:hypothetical protein